MNKARFSAFKSLLNSWHYNGFFITAEFFFNLVLIKLNFKKSLTFNNNKLFLRNGTSDLPVFRQVFMDYEYLLNTDRKAIKTIIDGGCNIGMASIYFAAQFPNAFIAGIEPDSKNFEQAILNTQHLKNVRLFKAGIWNRNCFLKTKSESNFGEWGITVSETDEKKSNTITAMTIDTIMVENNFQTIDILKLDIEGAEFEVFQTGFQSWLPKTRIIMIELHDFMKKNCSSTFFNALRETGINYSMSIRDENIIIYNNDFIIE